jgi:hypothetical protein
VEAGYADVVVDVEGEEMLDGGSMMPVLVTAYSLVGLRRNWIRCSGMCAYTLHMSVKHAISTL